MDIVLKCSLHTHAHTHTVRNKYQFKYYFNKHTHIIYGIILSVIPGTEPLKSFKGNYVKFYNLPTYMSKHYWLYTIPRGLFVRIYAFKH